MKVKDRYWEAENSIRFANPEKATRPLLCEPKVSEDGVRIRLWLRDLTGTGTGGAIALLSRDEAAVVANAIGTRRNWVGDKTDDALPRIGSWNARERDTSHSLWRMASVWRRGCTTWPTAVGVPTADMCRR